MKWDVCISTSITQRSSRGNTLVQLFEMQAKPADFLKNIYFYLKEQVTDKLWLFRLGYFQIFLENEPSEPVPWRKTPDRIPCLLCGSQPTDGDVLCYQCLRDSPGLVPTDIPSHHHQGPCCDWADFPVLIRITGRTSAKPSGSFE